MKYARTNRDRVVDLEITQLELGEEAVRIGETIEEVCDKFITISKNHPTQHLHNYVDVPREDYYLFDIYGAIWTMKGLIYVAKINRQGEWELL